MKKFFYIFAIIIVLVINTVIGAIAFRAQFGFLKELFTEDKDEKVQRLYREAASLQARYDFENSLEKYLEIKEIIKETDGYTSPGYVKVLGHLTEVYYELGSYEFAEINGNQGFSAFMLAVESGKTKGLKLIDVLFLGNSLAKVYGKKGEFDKMETLLKSGYDSAAEAYAENNPIFINYLNNLGILYTDLYNYNKAEQYLSEAKSYCDAYYDDIDWECSTINNSLGILYSHAGDYERAVKYFKNARTGVENSIGRNSSSFLNITNNLGYAYLKMDKLDVAGTFLLEAWDLSLSDSLNLSISEYVQVYNSVSEYYLEKGDILKSSDFIEQSLEIQNSAGIVDRIDYANTLTKFALIQQRKGDFQKSFELLKEAGNQLKEYLDENIAFSSQEGRFEAFDVLFKQQDIFSSLLYTGKNITYDSLIVQVIENVLFRKGLSAKVSRRQSQQVFSTPLVEKSQLSKSLDSLKVIYEAGAFDNNIDQDSLIKLSDDIDYLERQLYRAYYSSFLGKNALDDFLHSVSLKEIRKNLKSDEVAIEISRFRLFKERWTDSIIYCAFVIDGESKGGAHFIELGEAKQVEGEFFKHYNKSIRQQLNDTISYGRFFGKLVPFLRNKTKVYISLDGVYHRVALSSLQKSSGRYFGDDCQLIQLSSTADLVKEENKYRKNNTAALFGGPAFFIENTKEQQVRQPALTQIAGGILDEDLIEKDKLRNDLSPLPYSEVEVKFIDSLLSFNKWDVGLYMGPSALEENVKKLNSPGVLHLATHGFFIQSNNDLYAPESAQRKLSHTSINPLLRSGLFLAGSKNFLKGMEREKKENGILTAYEVASLNLNKTKLVVLSACETGRGDIKNGDGVIGLQTAFQIAGAKNILFSLWKVDDQATQLLMNKFYKEFLITGEVHQAFRKAQLELRQDSTGRYNHPFYWGAFVVLGK